MKLVIDIPEKIYKRFNNEYYGENEVSKSVIFELFMSITHATPLTDCTDAISREEVIESALNVPIAPIVDGDKVTVRRVVFLEDVLSLPTVNPTTNRAKWIKVGEHLYECSCCGYNYRNYDGQVMKFCMNCGSVMEGGE